MSRRPLLAQLSSKFAAQDEVVATDALAIILRQSKSACMALGRYLGVVAGRVDALPVSRVAPQHSTEEQGRPDLAVFGERERLIALIEGKFWAELTEAQPVEYLNHLGGSGGEVLLFICPGDRLESLFVALLGRAREAGMVSGVPSALGETRFIRTAGSQTLAITAWGHLLTMLRSGCEAASDFEAVSDLDQLKGLVERYEAEGFAPLSSRDLTDLTFPRRARTLAKLLESIIRRGEDEGLFMRPKGNQNSSYYTWGGRTVSLQRASGWIGVHYDAWAWFHVSPIWLRFWGDTANAVAEALKVWESAEPRRVFRHVDDASVFVPLMLLPGAERVEVEADVMRQCRELDAKLEASGMPRLGGA